MYIMYVSRLGMQSVTLFANSSIYSATGTLRNEYGFGNLTTMNKIIGNLIRCHRITQQQEMIMGLDMNDNN